MLSLKSFFNFLKRNKSYTLINLIGLSISLMFVILIVNYTIDETTIDRSVKKSERIYAVSSEEYIASGFWIGQKFHARYPEIENYCAVVTQGEMAINCLDNRFNAQYLCVDTSFFNMFSVEPIEGDLKNALISQDNVVLSQSFARKVFGNTNAVGKTIKFDFEDNKERVVSAVVANFDNSIFPNFDILLNSIVIGNYNEDIISEQMSNAGSSSIFLLVHEGLNNQLLSKTDDMKSYLKGFFWPYMGGASQKVELVPFNEIYFCPQQSFMLRKGEKNLLIILVFVGLLILLFAVVNYINLTTAQTGFRAKEMATRRLLGSSRGALFRNLILESFLMCAVAFVLGLILAIFAEPYTNTLLHSKIDISNNFSVNYILGYLGFIALLSIISGIIPAFVITNFKPIEIVHGTFRRKTSMIYSKFLIAFQNIITIALIACSITTIWQVQHLLKAPLGYTYEGIIDISTNNNFKSYAQVKELVDELRQLPCVSDVALSLGTPLNGGNNNTISFGENRMVSFQMLISDSSFFKMLNLRLKKDNHPTELSNYFNEQTFKEMEISEDVPVIKIGTKLESELKVGGIYYDFKIRNMLMDPTACMIVNLKNFDDYNKDGRVRFFPWDILVKVQGDEDKALEEVKSTTLKITKAPEFDGQFMADQLKQSYAEQIRVSNIMLIFTCIAIIISTLGLLAMSTYYIQQRQTEIAVRKVFGSTSKEVLIKIISTFMKTVGIAFVVSIPIIWSVMNWWLNDFTYHIQLSPLIFVLAGIFASIVAFISVFWQSKKAANTNPIDSIKR